MYTYHNTPKNLERIEKGICRCRVDEDGRVFSLGDLVQDGLINDPYAPGVPLGEPTVPDHLEEAYSTGPYIYAVSKNFEIKIALDCDRSHSNAVKHETIFHNADVFAAGEIRFEAGLVSAVNDQSGSYVTIGALSSNPDAVAALLRAFEDANVPLAQHLRTSLNDRLE